MTSISKVESQNMIFYVNLLSSISLSFMSSDITKLSCQALITYSFVCVWAFVIFRTENMARKAAGEEPRPEEDPSNPIFKPLPEPSRLDSYLITNQVANYCYQINGYVEYLV